MPSVPEIPGPRLALVIASSSYTDPGLAQLRAPAQDAAEMIDVLADPDIGGFEVTPVLDRPEYEIRRAVDAFLTGRSLDDLVVLYLSCHGVLDGRGACISPPLTRSRRISARPLWSRRGCWTGSMSAGLADRS